MLDLQQADLVAAVRSRLGIRGLVKLAIDETIAPTAAMFNLDASPWRINGYRWYGRNAQAAVAAQFSSCQCGIPTAAASPAGGPPAIIGVIDQLIIINTSASADAVLIGMSNGLQGFYNGQTSVPELATPSIPNPGSPVQTGGTNGVGHLVTNPISAVQLAAGAQVIVPGEWAIVPGTLLVLESFTVNLALSVSFSGRVWVSS